MGAVNHRISASLEPLLSAWPAYLLQSIVHGSASAQPPQSDHWPALFAAAQNQQLAPLLYWALQKSLLEYQPPQPLMQQMRRGYISATFYALQQEHELRTVLTALNGCGIRPTLYKGAALAHTVYPTPACRPMGDLDLWVTVEEMAVAQAAIEELGYHAKEKAERPVALQRHYDGEIPLIGKQRGKGTVELHWGVFPGQWLQQTAEVDRAGIYKRRVKTELLDASVYLLTNEDAVIQLAVHLAITHQLSHHPLRSLLDIALLDQQNLDWGVVVERVRQWRLATVMSVVLDLLISVFGAAELSPGANAAAAALRDTAQGRLFTERWRDPAIVFDRAKLSASRSRFFYLLTMVDKPTDALYLLMRTLWPETEWLEARYGHASNTVRLRHIKSAFQGKL